MTSFHMGERETGKRGRFGGEGEMKMKMMMKNENKKGSDKMDSDKFTSASLDSAQVPHHVTRPVTTVHRTMDGDGMMDGSTIKNPPLGSFICTRIALYLLP